MQKLTTQPKLVRVAVGAVVDNVSSIDLACSPLLSFTQLLELDAADLRVLITLRRKQRVLGGYWELPGGKIEVDESATQAVERELIEEVGIVVRPVLELPAVDHVYEHARVRLEPWVCTRVEGAPRTIDVDDVRWVALEELSAYRFPEATLPVLEALRRCLGESV